MLCYSVVCSTCLHHCSISIISISNLWPYVCRPADVLGIDREPGNWNGFTGRHRTSYTPEWVQSRLHRHHSVQQLSLHFWRVQKVSILHYFSNIAHDFGTTPTRCLSHFIIRSVGSRANIISRVESRLPKQFALDDLWSQATLHLTNSGPLYSTRPTPRPRYSTSPITLTLAIRTTTPTYPAPDRRTSALPRRGRPRIPHVGISQRHHFRFRPGMGISQVSKNRP